MMVGDEAFVTRVFTEADVDAYLSLGGPSAAPGEVPPPLIGALFSYLLGVHLPGRGANYLKQQSDYLAAAQIGEPLTATVTVTRLRPDKALVDLETLCRDSAGRVLCRGRALIHADDVGKA